MLKKMVIGVTTLSFMLVLGASTANSGTIPIRKGLKPLPTVNVDAPGYGLEEGQSRFPLSFNKLDYNGAQVVAPEAKNHTPVFFCTDQDNSDYGSGFTLGFPLFHNGFEIITGVFVTGHS
ncbi:MAG: hypothetical protein IIB00_08140, partial [candidate division Zixibacteria bacterium]|nr:hypothetical protein [candidate division Zixibacteria bacterium]